MNPSTRRLVASALVVLYGGIALVDQGLHLLVPHGVHQLGMDVVEWTPTDGHAGCTTACSTTHDVATVTRAAAAPHTAALVSRDHEEHSHTCAICAYLTQARSGLLRFSTAADWRPLIAVVVVADERHESQAVLGRYAPRGPPLCAA